MIKTTHPVLIILAATVFNIVLTVLCLAVLMLIYMVLLVPRLPKGAALAGTFLLFAVAIVLSFLIYRRVLKAYLKKKTAAPFR